MIGTRRSMTIQSRPGGSDWRWSHPFSAQSDASDESATRTECDDSGDAKSHQASKRRNAPTRRAQPGFKGHRFQQSEVMRLCPLRGRPPKRDENHRDHDRIQDARSRDFSSRWRNRSAASLAKYNPNGA